MFGKKYHRYYIFFFFLLLPLLFFKNYFLKNQVPFSANLLVSFYSPWKFETFKGYEGGIPNKPIGFDNIKIFYPHLQLTLSELSRGRIPFWNPYVFSGNVHLGLFQTAVFYPLNFIYALLPTIDAWSFLVIVQPFLAALFMYLFIWSQRLSKGASIFGAVVYAYSGWMIAWWEESLVIEHSILWLPLALYASSQLWESSKKLQNSIILLLSLVMSILAGFFQTTIYLFAAFIAWNIYMYLIHRRNRTSAHPLLYILGIMVIALLLTGAQWIPAVESFFLSPRKYVDAKFLYDSYLMPFRHLLTFIAPDFWGNPGTYNYFFPKAFYHEKVLYMGIIPLFFFLYAYCVRLQKHGVFWKLFSLVTLSLGFQLPTSWVWYVFHVPVLSSAQPSRIFTLTAFGLSVLSAYGLQHYIVRRERKIILKLFIILFVIILSLWIFVILNLYYYRFCPIANYPFCNTLISYRSMFDKPYMTISLRNLIIPSILVVCSYVYIYFIQQRRTLIFGVICLTLIGSLYFSSKFLYFSDRRFVFPETPIITQLKEHAKLDRVWSYGNAYVEKNFLSYFGLYSPEGYDPFFSQDYGELLGTIRTSGRITGDISRADADLSPAGEDIPLMANPYRARMLNLLGVRYIIETKLGEKKDVLPTKVRFPNDDFSLVWENDRWRLWESVHAMPRAFFVSSYLIRRGAQNIADSVFAPTTDISRTVILEKEPFSDIANGASQAKGNVSILSYEPSQVVLTSQSEGRGVVFLSDTYHSEWIAYVDGAKTDILKADYAFRAIPVTGGNHTIVLKYQPGYVVPSLIMALSGFGLFVMLSFAMKKQSIKL